MRDRHRRRSAPLIAFSRRRIERIGTPCAYAQETSCRTCPASARPAGSPAGNRDQTDRLSAVCVLPGAPSCRRPALPTGPALPLVLDIPALRSLTAIVDLGGFHRAADSLHLSQSGVSQHVRKLERTVGHRLFERRGRETRLTPWGEALVADARRILDAHDAAVERLGLLETTQSPIAIGATEHAADHILGAVTGALRGRFPAAGFRFRLDRSGRLNEAVDRGAIDVIIFVGEAGHTEHLQAGSLPLGWYAAPGFECPSGSAPVPLVAIDGPCTIRRRALQTLADHDMPSDVVAEAAHVGGVLHAVRAGLGVALLAAVGPAPEGLERREDLPAVGPEDLRVRVRRGADPELGPVTAAAVSDLVAEPVTA